MISFEECQKLGKKRIEEKEELRRRQEQIHKEELRKKGIDPAAQAPENPKYDHPCMPDDGFVTVLYVIGMIASLIFKDFWILWIILSVIYGKFITRHDND